MLVPMGIMLTWCAVLVALVVADAPQSWRETRLWICARIWWTNTKVWAIFARQHAEDWLWLRTVGRLRAWHHQRRSVARERKALPIYIRCTEHKDFGGHCENDATWADVDHPDFPTHCDDCVVQDGTVKRVGLTGRPKLPQETKP